jgi:hypothetical protein
VAALLERVGGALRIGAVFHAAGVLADSTVMSQTRASFEKAFQAKARGAWHLHQHLPELRLFVLFSSIASTFVRSFYSRLFLLFLCSLSPMHPFLSLCVFFVPLIPCFRGPLAKPTTQRQTHIWTPWVTRAVPPGGQRPAWRGAPSGTWACCEKTLRPGVQPLRPSLSVVYIRSF